MPSLNKIILIGRLVADPELKYAGENPVASFRIAVDRIGGKNPDGSKKADFFTCKAWRQRADFVTKYVTKGRLVAVEGRVELNDFTGSDGVKKYFTEVVVDQVELLDSQRDRPGEAAPSGGYGAARSNFDEGASSQQDSGYQAAPAKVQPAAPRQAPVASARPAYPDDEDFDNTDPFADE